MFTSHFAVNSLQTSNLFFALVSNKYASKSRSKSMIKISHSKLDVSVVTLQHVYFWKTFRIIHDISHVKMSGQQYIIRKEGNIWRDTCHGKNWFDFKLHEYLSNHQLGETPLFDQIKFLCLKRFPLEIMHCVYLCGTKRKLIFVTEGPMVVQTFSKSKRYCL